MISKKYMPKSIESSQQQAENGEWGRQKREWVDPAMMQVMSAADAHNGPAYFGDGGGCGSFPFVTPTPPVVTPIPD